MVDQNAADNTKAERYVVRSADRENLEASDAFFAEFVKEVHNRGMKVILDGVFNHCGSFNKWLDAEQIYERSGDYEPGAYISKDSLITAFSIFMTTVIKHGLTTAPMTAGGGMIPCQS